MGTGELTHRCAECHGLRHDRCARRSGTGACHCAQCWHKIAIAGAGKLLTSNDIGMIRSIALDFYSFDRQRERRRSNVARRGPLPPFPCACGRVNAAGEPCTVRNAITRQRRTATVACRQYVSRRKRRMEALHDAPHSAPSLRLGPDDAAGQPEVTLPDWQARSVLRRPAGLGARPGSGLAGQAAG
jgi:hypothetical protein